MKWSHEKTVSPNDLDLNYIASPSAYLRYMQEAAHMQMMEFPPTPDELKDEHKVFVLSRVSLSVHKPLHACDRITVSTWACEGHGVTFPRCAQIVRGSDTVADITSVWALVDTENRSLYKVSDYNCTYTTEEPVETRLPVRFRMPKDAEFEYAGDFKATYADADLNRHVNNARYPDIFCSYLPTMDGLMVRDLNISYLHETKLGQTVGIYVAELNGGFGVRSVLPDGTINTEAFIVTEKLDKH